MRGKKICIICQRFPYPARRGDQLAVSKIIEALVIRKHQISVYCFELDDGGTVYNWCIKKKLAGYVEFKKLKMLDFSSFSKRFHAFILPLQVALYSFSNFNDQNYDVIYCQTVRMSMVPKFLMGKRYILGAQINFAKEFRERSRETAWYKRPIYALEAKLMETFLPKIVRKFDVLIQVADGEYDDYTDLIEVKTISHGVDLARIVKPKHSGNDKIIIGFWGNHLFTPNVQAGLKLLAWKPKHPEKFQLKFFGRGAETYHDSLSTIETEIIGEVDDIDREIDKIDVLVNLIDTGGGFQNKTVEAFARGKRVVGTWKAFRGLNLDPTQIEVIEDLKELEDQLLSEPNLNQLEYCQRWLKQNWDKEKNIEKIVQEFYK